MDSQTLTAKRIIARNIRKYRAKSGYTQEEVADLADLALNYYQRLELVSQKELPSITTLFKIAKVLKVHPSRLLN